MRRRLLALVLCLALVPTIAAAIPAAAATPVAAGATRVSANGVTATITDSAITLSNDVAERTWTTTPFGTSQMRDRRTGLTTGASPDFRLRLIDGVELTGKDFTVADAKATKADRGGVTLTMTLKGVAGTVTRQVTAHPGVAGFEIRTTLAMPGILTGYTLDEIALPDAAPTVHHFSAGYDWRGSDTPDWEPQLAPFGGANTGDHRETRTAPRGQSLEAGGEWLSAATATNQTAFAVMERVNYASSRGAYDGKTARANVDLNRDLIYLGPLEADAHFANPDRVPARHRLLNPLKPLALEPVFTGLAIDADDEAWQYAKYLDRRMPRWSKGDITFNSNGVDDNRISTGAKDDMDFAEVKRQAAVAQKLGVDTFILDDGWQAISGDWCPDSPQCPEPRNGDDPKKFAPRFPDAKFEAVREVLGDMKLGLWMSPMHFNPSSQAAARNPGWICNPVGTGTTLANMAQPDSSSNEAGIGQWNPEGVGQDGKNIDYVEGKIRTAITDWKVSYFKFDFLAWLDCAGAETITAYEYRESFIRMLDRIQADHPKVTIQIDETNDYRLFPFESVTRGPSWYANGGPDANEALHNLWLLSPYIPAYTLGQQTLAGERDQRSTEYLMAVALASHWTYFTDLTKFTDEQVATAGKWADLYHRERDRFAQFTYPLLDDPISGKNWTALQPWNADEQSGALMVYRQDAAEESKTVALRGVRGDGTYRVTEALTGATIGEYTAGQLRDGLTVALPQRYSAKVLLIDPV